MRQKLLRNLFVTMALVMSLSFVANAQIDWSMHTAYAMENFTQGDPVAAEDFSAVTKIMWDLDSIYVHVEITDDSLNIDHGNAWERDQVELYFDMDNSKQDGAYDANDVAQSFYYDTDNSGAIKGAARSTQMTTATGWNIEIAIPWDSLMLDFVPTVDGVIGFDVQVIDNDGANRESKITLMALVDETWRNTAYMGTLQFIAAGKTMPVYPEKVPWSGVSAVKLENSFYDDPTDAADFSATAKTIWDSDSIYVYVDIKDDSLNVSHNNSWERDLVELYFDMDNSKQDGAYDANDMQLGFYWNTDNSGVLNGAAKSTQMTTETGWTIQIAIPWDSLMMGFDPAVDGVIGFDVQIIDNDGFNRESKISMMALADEGWHVTAYMGTLQFLAAGKTMPVYPEKVPWSGVSAVKLENSFYDDPTDAADFSATAKTIWDSDSIYVYVDIKDDSLNVSHNNSWERDLVELYFDMDNSKQDGAYDANDMQLGFYWNTDNSGVLNGAAKSTQMTTETGWTIQIAIPWDSLMMGFDPAVDGVIGFDVQIIDNDGFNRESKISMMALADEGWHVTAYMGTLQFLAAGKTMPLYPTTLPWSTFTGVPLGNSFYDDPADAADFSAIAKTKWDDDNIYVLVEVKDDSLNVAHANSWERDLVELYFDMDNSKQDGAYDSNDFQFAFYYDNDNSGVSIATTKQWKTTDGWAIDIAIPFDSLMDGFTPAVDGIIGYDVQAVDNDGANRESKIAMMALADEGWQNVSYMGELKFLADNKTEPIYKAVPTYYEQLYVIGDASPVGWEITSAIAMTPDANDPTIFTWEGPLTASELKFATQNVGWDQGDEITALTQGADAATATTYQIRSCGDGSCTGDDNKWMVAVAGDYLITINLKEETISFEQQGVYPQLYVIGDACPVGWEITNAIAMTVDETDPTIFTWEGPLTASEIKFETQNVGWDQGDEITALTQGADAATATTYQIRDCGDGSCTGDDNKWMVAEAGTYLVTINLTAVTISFELQTGIKDDAFANISIYPNPVSGILHIANAENVNVIELVNLLGQVTMRHLNSGNSNAVLPVENQESGIYMIRFTDTDNQATYRKLIIK